MEKLINHNPSGQIHIFRSLTNFSAKLMIATAKYFVPNNWVIAETSGLLSGV